VQGLVATMHDLSQIYRTWRHHEGTNYYFDRDYARELIEEYNRTGDQQSLNDLLEHIEPLARSILEYRCTTRHESIDELLSRIRIKIWRSLRLYDPSRGSAFSFCAKIISSTAASIVGEAWNRQARFLVLDEADRCAAPSDASANEAIEEIEHLVRQVKTGCTNRYELDAQRWFVDSFIDCGFHIRRHEASDAVMKVFGLDHSRSRQLFDLTMVAVRRELIPDRRLSPVTAFDLRGTKIQALVRYAKYLSSSEFTRLAVLLRDVAPSVVLTVNPRNGCAIRRGDWQAIRFNLRLVLNGSPSDHPLFGI
jgi:DNA-directed RNA polymerase specialized sigma24 family protein